MGLRAMLRRYYLARGQDVPGWLVRKKNRVFYGTVNSVTSDMIILDIGANQGKAALAFAARGARVIAYEPNPDIYNTLLDVVARYPTISPHNCGVLDKDAEMELYLHNEYDENPLERSEASSFYIQKPNVSDGRSVSVRVRDVAKIIDEIGEQIDIVKIDVEGSEYRILTRMIESGAIGKVNQVYIETHHDRIPGLQAEFDAVKELIKERGVGDKVRFDWY